MSKLIPAGTRVVVRDIFDGTYIGYVAESHYADDGTPVYYIDSRWRTLRKKRPNLWHETEEEVFVVAAHLHFDHKGTIKPTNRKLKNFLGRKPA